MERENAKQQGCRDFSPQTRLPHKVPLIRLARVTFGLNPLHAVGSGPNK